MLPSLGGDIQKFKSLLENNSKFLLVNHIRMDPDAFGSLAGFYFLLKKLKKQVKATNDEATPEDFSFLSDEPIIEPNLDINEYDADIIISFDAASLEQLGKTYSSNSEIFSKKPFIVIDHHITNPGFGSLNIIDTTSSSSCELVYDITQALGYTSLIDENIATLFLAGIHTDTNTFYNKNTTSHTLEVAAQLLDLGARNKEIIFQFYRKKSLEKVHLWGEVMQNIKQEGKVSWVFVKEEQYKNTSLGDQGFKGLINDLLANIEGTDVALFLYEQEDKSIKVSLRSNRDDINVAEICSEFGGGGHRLAAGFTSNEKGENLENILLEKIKKMV